LVEWELLESCDDAHAFLVVVSLLNNINSREYIIVKGIHLIQLELELDALTVSEINGKGG